MGLTAALPVTPEAANAVNSAVILSLAATAIDVVRHAARRTARSEKRCIALSHVLVPHALTKRDASGVRTTHQVKSSSRASRSRVAILLHRSTGDVANEARHSTRLVAPVHFTRSV